MGTTFIHGIGVRKGRTPMRTIQDSIAYVVNPSKTRNGELVTAFQCSPVTAALEMMLQQKEAEQATGRKVLEDRADRDSYLLITMRQSFSPGEVDEDTAHEIGCKLAQRMLGKKYQYVVATHTNTHCVHNHIIFNIEGSDYKKYHQTQYTPDYLAKASDKLCKEYGLEVVAPSQDKKKGRGYSGKKETSYRDIIRSDIDRCVRNSQSFDEFLGAMRRDYYIVVAGTGVKYLHKTNGQKKYLRSYNLGEDYTDENVQQRIALQDKYISVSQRQRKQETASDRTAAPITLTQHKRNIEAMVRASGIMNEYGVHNIADFKRCADELRCQEASLQVQFHEIESQAAQLSGLLTCFEIINQYQDLEAEHGNALLKERFYQEHSTELDMIAEARQKLQNNSLNAEDSTARERLAQLRDGTQKRLSEAQAEYDSVHDRLRQLEKARRVVEKVHQDEQILTDRKGGNAYGGR